MAAAVAFLVACTPTESTPAPSVSTAAPVTQESVSGGACYVYPNGNNWGYYCTGVGSIATVTGLRDPGHAKYVIAERYPDASITVDEINCLSQKNEHDPRCKR